jgi:exosortase
VNNDSRTTSIAEAVALEEREPWLSVPLYAWVQIVIVTGLFIYMHANIIETMMAIAKRDPDWSHAFLIPFFSLYFIHHDRRRILAAERRTCWWGLPIFFGGLAAYFLAIYPVRSIMSQGYTMIIEIVGIVLLLLGPRILRQVWFPIVYLVFAVKFSSRFWNLIAWRLQLLAAQSATGLLNVLGVDAEVRGSTIELWHDVDYLGTLNVAEACSGLRMLMAFAALGVAIVYLVKRPWWARLTLIVLTVPIAVTVNVVRVTITGLLHLVNPNLSSGDFHVLIGMFMVFPAVLLFLFTGWVLDHLFVDEEPAEADTDLLQDNTPTER